MKSIKHIITTVLFAGSTMISSSFSYAHYQCIFFDADETLFSFDSFTGLKHLFRNYDLDFSKDDFASYQLLNKSLWSKLQKKEITQHELQEQRFAEWADKINISGRSPAVTTRELNDGFLDAMALTSTPLEGAVSLLASLKGKAKLALVTNGFTRLQRSRLENLGLLEHFEVIITSEAVGHSKPQPEIFNYALEQMQNPQRDKVLMIGDTLESDIVGGIRSSLDTCWINTHKKELPHDVNPTYQVSSLGELEQLLSAHYASGTELCRI